MMMICLPPRDTSPHQDSAGTATSGTQPLAQPPPLPQISELSRFLCGSCVLACAPAYFSEMWLAVVMLALACSCACPLMPCRLLIHGAWCLSSLLVAELNVSCRAFVCVLVSLGLSSCVSVCCLLSTVLCDSDVYYVYVCLF